MAITNSSLKSQDLAKEVFSIEIEAINQVKHLIDANFDKAIELLLKTTGKVVVTGMGKSGHIGAKIAATLASTGTPSFFVHPGEMGHGDLGMLTNNDTVIALSYSGNTEELRKILAPIKQLGVKLIAISGGKDSTLARFADIFLWTPIEKEACPLDLAPTSSTTVALVMGDAIAVTLMKHKNIQRHDFAKSHPLGSLGKSFIGIDSLMRKDKLPIVKTTTNFLGILEEINSKSLGFTTVINNQNQLVGTITDGDLRRAQLKFQTDIFNKTAEELMNKQSKTGSREMLASQAADLMKEYRISNLVIVDKNNNIEGILDLKDMLAEGFVI